LYLLSLLKTILVFFLIIRNIYTAILSGLFALCTL